LLDILVLFTNADFCLIGGSAGFGAIVFEIECRGEFAKVIWIYRNVWKEECCGNAESVCSSLI
jgi:hypothetical protein